HTTPQLSGGSGFSLHYPRVFFNTSFFQGAGGEQVVAGPECPFLAVRKKGTATVQSRLGSGPGRVSIFWEVVL
ncbi:hypothetical protein, partial [Desulfofundulus sp.]|uniref:hypothetical protein n=1 Tax=Desulfofundulus sp. TaxID=2282750 RepID=UPI003C71E6EE